MSERSRNLKEKMKQLAPYFLWALILIAFAILFYHLVKDSEFKGIPGILSVLKPIMIGLVLTFFIAPGVSKMEALLRQLQHWIRTTPRKIPVTKKMRASTNPRNSVIRFFAMLICYIVVLGILVLAFVYVIPQLINSISTIVTLATDSVAGLIGQIDKLADRWDNLPLSGYIDADSLKDMINSQIGNLTTTIQRFISDLIPKLYQFLVSTVSSLLNLIIGLIVSIYLIADRERMLRGLKKVIYALFNKHHSMVILNVGSETASIFKFFFLGKVIDSLIIGILCYFLMLILRLDYPLLIATIVGVTNIIPYFGPWIGAIPSVLILLLSSPMQALVFAIMVLILQQFDGNILGPYILGGTLGIKPFWIIFSVTVGGGLFGIIGMLFGVPAFTAIYTLVRRFITYRLEQRTESDLDQLEKEREEFSHPIVAPLDQQRQERQAGVLTKLKKRFKK